MPKISHITVAASKISNAFGIFRNCKSQAYAGGPVWSGEKTGFGSREKEPWRDCQGTLGHVGRGRQGT